MIIISYSASERESILQTDDESGVWKLETYQGKIVTKLKKLGIDPVRTREDGQHLYELDFNQVSFRSGKKRTSGTKRVMTEEHKQKLQDGRKNKKENENV
jgi:hypothetical protein